MLRVVLTAATCLLLVLGQLLLKHGLKQTGPLHLDSTSVWRALSQWRVAAGLALLFFSLLAWMGVLSRGQVSFFYPVLALTALPVVLLSWWYLGETLTMGKVVGTLIMLAGVIVVIRDGQP